MAFVLIYVIIFAIVFNLPYSMYVPALICAALGVVCASFIGIYIDAINPCVLWEEEQHVLRGNLNTFSALVAVIMVFMGITVINWALLFRLSFSIIITIGIDIIILSWIAILFYKKV